MTLFVFARKWLVCRPLDFSMATATWSHHFRTLGNITCHHIHIASDLRISQTLTETCSTYSCLHLTHTLVTNKKEGKSPITGGVEYCLTSNPASPFKTLMVERDVLSKTLDDLTPSTEYEVREENVVGHSDPSTSKLTKTKPDSEFSTRSAFQVYEWNS